MYLTLDTPLLDFVYVIGHDEFVADFVRTDIKALQSDYHFELIKPFSGYKTFFHFFHGGSIFWVITHSQYLHRIWDILHRKDKEERELRLKFFQPVQNVPQWLETYINRCNKARDEDHIRPGFTEARLQLIRESTNPLFTEDLFRIWKREMPDAVELWQYLDKERRYGIRFP